MWTACRVARDAVAVSDRSPSGPRRPTARAARRRTHGQRVQVVAVRRMASAGSAACGPAPPPRPQRATIVAATGPPTTMPRRSEPCRATLRRTCRSPWAQRRPPSAAPTAQLIRRTTVSYMSSNLPFGFGQGDPEPRGPAARRPDALAARCRCSPNCRSSSPGRAARSTGTWPGSSRSRAVAGAAPRRYQHERVGGRRSGAAGRPLARRGHRSAVRYHARSRRGPELEWIEKTLPVWSALCDPLAARVVAAMSSVAAAEEARRSAPEPAGRRS